MKANQEGLIDQVRDALDIHGRVERNPYGMVAGALAVGFLMGGGLFSRLTDRLAGTALRIGLMAAWPRLDGELHWLLGRRRGAAGMAKEKGESE
jgi:hypothetical protein